MKIEEDKHIIPLEEQNLERNVVTLGWVAFFGGLAQDMILTVFPLFIRRC
jgi:hypothetical protein